MKPLHAVVALLVAALVVWVVAEAGSAPDSEGDEAMHDAPDRTGPEGGRTKQDTAARMPGTDMSGKDASEMERAAPDAETGSEERLATFGAGCFWCVEAVFQELDGVLGVESGYAGGQVDEPTYREVCSGTTGHAEVVQVRYDPERVRFADLLEVFWKTHDPTTPNRQGADVGTQYRSVIFHHDEAQRRQARAYKQKLDASGAFDAPIVTEIAPLERFWSAEADHQDYYARNAEKPYCRAVIQPKLEKFRKVFTDKLAPADR